MTAAEAFPVQARGAGYEYTLLRGLGRYYVLPADDVGARNNLRRRFGLAGDGGHDAVAELSRAWWPYAGLVYFHLLLDTLAAGGHLALPVPSAGAPARALPPAVAGRPPRRNSC